MLKRILFSAFCCVSVLHQDVDASAVTDSNAVLIPRHILLSQPDRVGVSMNHKGDMIAYISRKGVTVELCVTTVNGKVLKRFPIKESRDMFSYRWSADDRYILIPQDENGDENNHIVSLNVLTGAKRDLTPYTKSKSVLAGLSKKYANKIVALCNKRDPQWFDVYKIDVDTGKTELVYQNNEFISFTFDRELQLRIATQIDNEGATKHYLIKNGQKAELLENFSFEDSYTSHICNFSADNNVLYVINSKNRDIGALYAYDLASNEKKIVFEPKYEISSLSYDPVTHVPQIVSTEYLKQNIEYIDAALASDLKRLQDTICENFIIVSRSNDDKNWLIVSRSDTKSNRYYVYNRDNQSVKFLFSAHPTLDRYSLQSMEPIEITARDGLRLVCYLTRAVNYKKNGKLVLLIHGGPWVRDSFGLNTTVQLLANRGYSVLQVNYRGSLGFGKNFVSAINGNLEKVRNDIIDAANWAVANGIAAADQVAIMGGSFGGYSTLAGLAYTPDVFCCGVDIVGPSNWLTLFKSVPAYWKPAMIGWYKTAGDPDTCEGRKRLWELSPLSKVDNISKPLIVFQGQYDPRVNVKESEQIVQALKQRNVPVVYVLYPDEGHGFLKEPNRKSYMAICERFLSKFLGGWYEPISEQDTTGSSHQIIEGNNILF